MLDPHTTETTGNEPFPIGHGTNYFLHQKTHYTVDRKHLLFIWLCASSVKTVARHIIHQAQLSSVVRRS